MTLLLGACLYISDDEQRQRLYQAYLEAGAGGDGDGNTDDPAPPAPEVSEISPSFATTAGGEVVLHGDQLDAVDAVRFGTEEAEIAERSTDTLWVVAPPQSSAGAVDVVAWAGDESSGPASFEYILDGEGLFGLYAWIGWTDMVGGYWSTEPEDFGDAWLALVEPTALDAVAAAGLALDESCVRDPEAASIVVYDWGGTASLLSEAGNVDLDWDGNSFAWSAYPLALSGSLPGAAYGLEFAGLDIVGDASIVPLGEFPAMPGVSAPDITGTDADMVTRSFAVRWQVGEGDFVAIQLGLWNSAGTGHEEFVTCLVEDDGSFTVPLSAFSDWPTNRQLDVIVDRVSLDDAVIPWNGARTSVWAYSREYGAVLTR